MLIEWLQEVVHAITRLAPPDTYLSFEFNVLGLSAVILVSLVCGGVGSLVVGNRMAFFSDALAHCAFAGAALGLLIALFIDAPKEGTFLEVGVPLIMVMIGIIVGLGIAYVREKTGLSSDTVIGVFFAGAIGFGAMLLKALSSRTAQPVDSFLWGNPLSIRYPALLLLLSLTLITTVVMLLMYNSLTFISFNPSLARSRQLPLRLCNYLFIVLLALIVNICLWTIGVLVINALLVVPAATASNLTRNLRQLFWTTIGLCLFVSVVGHALSWEAGPLIGLQMGVGGTIVVLSVLLFFVSMLVGPILRGRQAH